MPRHSDVWVQANAGEWPPLPFVDWQMEPSAPGRRLPDTSSVPGPAFTCERRSSC